MKTVLWQNIAAIIVRRVDSLLNQPCQRLRDAVFHPFFCQN